MQYILRDPRGACQVDWIQDARPAPRSRSLEVNYSSNSDLANRFKVERWATFAQTWCELNLASRATNEWRYFNCSRLTVIILTVFLCKLYRIAGFYLNRTPLLFQLDRRRPSLLFPSILSLLVKMYRGGGVGGTIVASVDLWVRFHGARICLSKAEKTIFRPKSRICSYFSLCY